MESFINVPSIKFQGNSPSASFADPCGQTDRWTGGTEMTKLIGAFHAYAKAPKTSLQC